MDEQTALVFALQLVALFSIAGALLLYLVCKIRSNSNQDAVVTNSGAGKSILITSCDNAVGLQIAIHLANRGFRVFAGLKEGASSGLTSDSISSRIIRSWQKHRESILVPLQGALIALPFDVTREDLSHEAVDIIRAHLPAGEDGIWAIINSSGLSYRGRFDQQDVAYWDAMFKTNVIGALRTAKNFLGLLRNTGGRLINFGATEDSEPGLVAYFASRYAVEGSNKVLRKEFATMGIKIITINPNGISPDLLFVSPKLKNGQNNDSYLSSSGILEYQPIILSPKAMETVDIAITSSRPEENYNLAERNYFCKKLPLLKIV